MARIAKFRLRFDQQKLRFGRVVRRMARNAGDIVLRVQRIDRRHVFRAGRMARQAARVNVFGGSLLEKKKLRGIGRIGDVTRRRSVARLAPLLGRSPARIERGVPVRTLLPAGVFVRVADFAGLRSNIIGSARSRRAW